ncbi:MAG: hypothetical protein E7Z80_06310 [Methanobrevibacter thaueri]|nr:hypothetical protein [Methanobrevibacter thaueri]
MLSKKSIIIIILMFIILFSGYGLIKTHDKSVNDTTNNNTTNNTNTNGINSKNISHNITNNSSNINNKLNNNYRHHNNFQHDKSKDKTNKITDEEILEIVKKGVYWDDGHGGTTKNVRLGSIYKGKKGLWLVPAFDKKTGKFLGAVWVASDGHGFFGGVDSYSDYKKIISGKTQKHNTNNKKPHKQDSNKLNNQTNKSNKTKMKLGNLTDSSIKLNQEISNITNKTNTILNFKLKQ